MSIKLEAERMNKLLPLAVLTFVVLLATTVTAYDCDASIWWTMNDTTDDTCGGYTATNNGAAYTPFMFANGTDFEAGDPDSWVRADGAYEIATNRSWGIWISPETIGANNRVIANKRTNTDNTLNIMLMQLTNNSLRCACGTGAYLNVDGGNIAVGGNTSVVCVADVTNSNLSLWINGSYVDEVAGACNQANTGRLSLGCYENAGACVAGVYFDGLMDEFFYLNRTLSSTEIGYYHNYANFSIPICTVSFTPTAAIVNESSTFTAAKSVDCGAWDGNYYWNYTRWSDGVQYFSGSSNPDTQTLNYTSNWSVNFTGTIGGINYTVVQNVTVGTRPVANFSIDTTPPFFVYDTIQFNDTSTNYSEFGPIDYWWWDFDDTNTSNTENATNIFILPGEYNVTLMVNDSRGFNSSAEAYEEITINGFAIDVFDETTYAAITMWNVTISNSTGCSYSATNQNNTWVWSNFSSVCTGSVTISLVASGYIQRVYYGVYNTGSYIDLDAYLLDSATGVYPVFIVRDGADYSPIQGAVLTFMKSIGGTYTTVAQATTDASGTTQVYLSPTTTYRMTVVASGYTTYTTDSFTPVSTTYIITLSGTTTYDYTNSSDRLYMILRPQSSTEISNTTLIEFICNDPWSNVNYFNLTVIHSNGTTVFVGNGTSASCGIITVNASTLDLTLYQWITVNGTVNRNGIDYFTTKTYYVHGSSPPGTNVFYWAEQASLNDWIDGDTQMIIALLVTGGAVLAGVMTFGFGAGLVGIPVMGFFVWVNWLPVMLWLLISVATILVYATKRWDR